MERISQNLVQVEEWGTMPYAEAFDRQAGLVAERVENKRPDTLVFVEHPPVYTLGSRIGAEQHLVWKEAELDREGITVQRTNRGGDITYHGPGQIVGYPIMNISESKDLHLYLRNLEEVLIRTVAHYGIEASRREGKTGIWIADRKIAAIGVAVRRWVTYHGFALNVQPDLNHFTGIVPCGITDGTVTSMELEKQRKFELSGVKSRLALEFAQIFRKDLIHG